MVSVAIYTQAARSLCARTALLQPSYNRMFTSCATRYNELDSIYDNFNKHVSDSRNKPSKFKGRSAQSPRNQGGSPRPASKRPPKLNEKNNRSNPERSSWKRSSSRPRRTSRYQKEDLETKRELYRKMREKEAAAANPAGEPSELGQVREAVKSNIPTKEMQNKPESDSKSRDDNSNRSHLAFNWEKWTQELDNDPKYARLTDPHKKFLAQLRDWGKYRKDAGQPQANTTVTQEPPNEAYPDKLSNPAKRYKGELKQYIDPIYVKLKEVPNKTLNHAPELSHNLDRVLFSPGVHVLKDKRTGVYNFPPSLEHVMSIRDFDFTKVTPFIPSANDTVLSQTAKENNKLFTSSTSSLTGIFMQMHYLISRNRPPVTTMLSKAFPESQTTFTTSMRKPVSAFLRYRAETGTYSLDSDKSQDEEIILSLLGQVMETQLTVDDQTFREEYTKPHKPENYKPLTETPANIYHYSTCGDFVMRSQIDCYDPRLPGTGTFDLKTRAVCAVRHDLDYAQVHDGSDYQIKRIKGEWESFEREQFDLIRSALLKYSMQARIGRMDGIFVAYHNIREMFGFEYLPLDEIDKVFHSYKASEKDAPRLAAEEFCISVKMLSMILRQVIKMYPKQSVNLVFKASSSLKDIEQHGHTMKVFAHPMPETIVDMIQRGVEPPPEEELKTVPVIEELTDEEVVKRLKTHKLQTYGSRKSKRSKADADAAAESESSIEGLAPEQLQKQRKEYAEVLKKEAYLNRRTLFDLFRDGFSESHLQTSAWHVTVDNYMDKELLPVKKHPVLDSDARWTVGVTMAPVPHGSVFDSLASVIGDYVDEAIEVEQKAELEAEKQRSQSDPDKLAKEGKATRGESQPKIDEAHSQKADEETRARHLLINPPEVLQVAEATKSKYSAVRPKCAARLTSRPDTERRSAEELAKYVEQAIARMQEPSKFQRKLRKFGELNREEASTSGSNRSSSDPIVWTPKV